MSSNATPPDPNGTPDWSHVTLRTKEEIPRPTRFTPGLAAGIWCFVGAAIFVFTSILNPRAGGDGPIIEALLAGLVMVVVAYVVGGITWRLRGREDGAGRTAFSLVVGLLVLGALVQLANHKQAVPVARDPAPLLNATAAAMKAHFATALPKLAEADIAAEVDRRLAGFDAASASDKDAGGRARYVTVRNLLALGIASDLRVGAAIDALVAGQSSDWTVAGDPAALARMKSADASFLAAAERRYADDKELADRIGTDLQAAHFSAAEREQLQALLRKGAVAGRRVTEQVTALVELTRASEAAYAYLAANPGTWRIEGGEVRFNNGLLARDYAPLQNDVESARDKLRKLAQ
jgi:hypothetical protein